MLRAWRPSTPGELPPHWQHQAALLQQPLHATFDCQQAVCLPSLHVFTLQVAAQSLPTPSGWKYTTAAWGHEAEPTDAVQAACFHKHCNLETCTISTFAQQICKPPLASMGCAACSIGVTPDSVAIIDPALEASPEEVASAMQAAADERATSQPLWQRTLEHFVQSSAIGAL
jgi:hypothetical protein